jgi:hypothetical protein
MRMVPLFSSDQASMWLSIFLSRDPLPDIWIAIRQRNVIRFALSEKSDAVPTCQSHILEVESDAANFPFRPDERFQLCNALFVDPAAQGKEHLTVRLSVNSKHYQSPSVQFVCEG